MKSLGFRQPASGREEAIDCVVLDVLEHAHLDEDVEMGLDLQHCEHLIHEVEIPEPSLASGPGHHPGEAEGVALSLAHLGDDCGHSLLVVGKQLVDAGMGAGCDGSVRREQQQVRLPAQQDQRVVVAAQRACFRKGLEAEGGDVCGST